MKLLKASDDKGLTLIEIVLTMGVLVVIFAVGLPLGRDFQLDYQLDSEHELLKSALRQAANFSLINRNESKHGFYWDAANFTVFEGPSYAGRTIAEDRVFSRSSAITIHGPAETIFEALSGRTASSTYSLTDGRRTLNIYVNSEGTIYD